MKNNKAKYTLNGLGITIIGWFICEYILRALIGVATSYSSTLIGAVVDYYYRQCAHININQLTIVHHVSIMLISGMLISVAVIVIVHLIGMLFKKDAENFKEELEEYKSEFKYEINWLSGKRISPSDRVEDLKKGISEIDDYLNEDEVFLKETLSELSKYKKRIGIPYIIILLLSFLTALVFDWMPCLQKEKFNDKVILITPYVENHEVEKLRSDWLRMKTKSDYDEIIEYIAGVIEENHLED